MARVLRKERQEDLAVGVVTGRGAIRFERVLPGPIDRVWAFLTEPEKRGQWIASGSADLQPGAVSEWLCDYAYRLEPELRARHGDTPPLCRARTLECLPPRLLRTTWAYADGRGGSIETELSWALAEEGEVVRLVFMHSKLPDNDDVRCALAGWHVHLDVLADRLHGRQSVPFMAAHKILESVYKQRVSAP